MLGECPAGSELVIDMEKAIEDVIVLGGDSVGDASAVLSQAITVLTAYLDCLIAGGTDEEALLIPLRNDIRALRGQPLVTENITGMPDISPVVAGDFSAVCDDAHARRRLEKLGHNYGSALLRSTEADAGNDDLAVVEKVFQYLETLCQGSTLSLLWRVAGAYIEALIQSDIPWTLASKSIIRELDRAIRGLINGEPELPEGLLKNLLYYVALSRSDSPKAKAVLENFDLSLLPLPAGRNPLLGREQRRQLVVKLHQELDSSRELIAEYLGIHPRQPGTLTILEDHLLKIAALLSPVFDYQLSHQASALREYAVSMLASEPSPASFEELIEKLLVLESTLHEWQIPSSLLPAPFGESPVPKGELSMAMASVLASVGDDIGKVKHSLSAYCRAKRDPAFLDGAPEYVERLARVLQFVGWGRCAGLLFALSTYLCERITASDSDPPWSELDRLAESITCLEDHLVLCQDFGVDMAAPLLMRAERCLDALGYRSPNAPDEPEVECGPAVGETDPVSTQAEKPAPVTKEAKEIRNMDNDMIDPEIREVFLEEAHEVLDALHAVVPRWLQDNDDSEALVEMRRAFHTLKGSGRMVGANQIGEFAWAIENMLNRLIEGRIESGKTLQECVTDAVALLPEMLADFERDNHAVDGDRVAGLRELAGAIANNDTGLLTSLRQPSAGDGGAPGQENDQELWAIFAGEVQGHLKILLKFVQSQRKKAPFYEPPTPALQSALHTLKGSAYMAGLTTFADVMAPLEGFVRELLNFQIPAESPVLDLLEEAIEISQRYISGADSDIIEVDYSAFLSHLSSVREQFIAPHMGQEKPDTVTDPSALHDLMANGLEAVLDADEILRAALGSGAWDPVAVSQLQAELDSLIAAAGRAGVPPLVKLSALLSSLYGSLDGSPTAELVANLSTGHEALLDMIDALAAHQEVMPVPAKLVSALTLDGETAVTEGDRSEPIDNDAEEPVDWLPEEPDWEILELFLGEADELLETLEQGFQRWREAPKSSQHPDAIKRALHTFKGGARMAVLNRLGDISHDLETRVIASEKAIAGGDNTSLTELLGGFDLLVEGVDAVRQAHRTAGRGPKVATEAAEPEISAEPVGIETQAGAQIIPFTGTYRGLEPAPSGNQSGGEESESQEMVRVTAPVLETLVNLAGETSISRSQVEQQISQFMFSLDEMGAAIRRIQDQVRLLGIETDAQVMFRREQIEASESSEGFDPLEMDRYSLLQQLSRGLLESSSDLQDLRETLLENARSAESLLVQQSRINTDLQEGLMRTRMVPFSRLVPRIRRIVRQVAASVGKDVALKLESVDGEMDRTVMERIVPALEHMVRNAIDHGIEPASEREQSGKPAQGTLSLSFAREGADVLIRLADDGRGLDVDAIRRKALAQGLISEQANLSDNELQQFIFTPGFSTSAEVTQISGRGVGMDAVNSDVRMLGGAISIVSHRGAGTEFTVRLPFTVSVNRALMIEVGEDLYAIALSSITGVTRIGREQLRHFYHHPEERFQYGDEDYSVRYLGTLLSTEWRPTLDTALDQLPVLLVRSEGRYFALQVDGLIGSQEVVVKSLGKQFNMVPGLSGATVLGDGRVVVILDPQALLRHPDESLVLPPLEEKIEVQTNGIPTIMVVDDSVTVRKVTGRALERQGFRVITAKDGVDAMRMLQDNTPDAMLLDIEMPRMDGFEVARLVRSTQRLKDMPIVMITSRTGSKHRQRALSMGVNRYLGKPYQEDVLLNTLDELLNRAAVS